MSNIIFKVVGCIQTLELSISLQSIRRRSAGRGLERPPIIAREARRPTRGTPEECVMLFLACIYEVKPAII